MFISPLDALMLKRKPEDDTPNVDTSSPLTSTIFYDDREVSSCFIYAIQRYIAYKYGLKYELCVSWTEWNDEHRKALRLPVHYSIVAEAVVYVTNRFVHEGRRPDERMEELDLN